MPLRITTQGENRQIHALIQNIADIPGGLTIATADLIPGSILREGTVVSTKDQNGLSHVIKTAKVYEAANANATSIKVEKGSQLKVGDIIAKTINGAAVAIAAITTSNASYDTLTVTLNSSTGLGALTAGDALVEVAEAAAESGAALKYTPLAMVADSHDVLANDNLWIPAIVMGTFKLSVIPAISDDILSKLKGIIVL